MNILRHKKWHVRTKENVARVRRDEAKAAEEEKQKSERALIAENEDRVRRLKSKATSKNMDNIFGKVPDGVGSSSSITEIQTGHVNLFAELEDQERKNLTVGNKEYAAEKKKEQDDWESKVGIMKRFAEDTKEYSKESEWWQGIPIVREKADKPQIAQKIHEKFLTKAERKARKEQQKKAKKRKKKHRRHSSSSSDSPSKRKSADEKRKNNELLRRERLAREREEKIKVEKLFKKVVEPEAGRKTVVDDRQRRYNSQFNPEFAKY